MHRKNYNDLTNVCHIADLISLTDWVGVCTLYTHSPTDLVESSLRQSIQDYVVTR